MRLKFERHPLALANAWTIANQPKVSTEDPETPANTVLIVSLEANSGIQGWGEASPALRYREDIPACERFLEKVDPIKIDFENIDRSREYLRSIAPFNRAAAGAVEVALLDIAAQTAKQALHEFLGLPFPFQDGRSTTSFSIGIDEPGVVEKKARHAEAFPILKLKVGVSGDRDNFEALRRAAPEKTVRIDANEGWKTREEALRHIEWFARDGRVEFVEQPLPASLPLADHAWLKERSPLPIFADESYHAASDVDFCAEGFNGVNVKLVKTAGPIGARLALEAARNAGLKTMIGCMIETSVLITAAAHLSSLADYLDLDGNLLITNDPFEGIQVNQGYLSFGKDGLGIGLGIRRRVGSR